MITSKSVHPRKKWLAALLSLILPGLGQIYNGEHKKGLCLIILLTFWSFTVWGLFFLPQSTNLFIPFTILILISGLIYIYAAIDGWRIASRLSAYQRRWFNRWYIYIIPIFLSVTINTVMPRKIRTPLESFSKPSPSMAPSILIGENFYILHGNKNIEHGEVIAFFNPKDRTKTFVQRVIGLPGDTIGIQNDMLYLNGNQLTRESSHNSQILDLVPGAWDYLLFKETLGKRNYYVLYRPNFALLDKFEEITIPEGYVFVLGDNRDNSYDSRFFGLVAITDVVGRAKFISLSKDPELNKIRWKRIGQNLY